VRGAFRYGGRGFHPVMRMKKAKRSRIFINGRKTVALDYPASEPNILYRMMTGKRLSPDGDPYRVDGLGRSAVKPFFTITPNSSGALEDGVLTWLESAQIEPAIAPAAIQ